MPNWFITGNLGGGKGLVSVAKAFEYLSAGRRVASNQDLFLSGYYGPQSKRTYMRLPDKPTFFDLEAIGFGSDNVQYDENGAPLFTEDDHGLLILDELATWFNSRSWQDSGRKEVLDYLAHLRKRGWDCLLIVQDIDSVDKQLRGMLAEHLVVCRRLDRMKIPFVGGALRQFGLKGNMPKIHRAKVHYGETQGDLVVDTWTYTGKRYYRAYNTLQRFSSDYPHGPHSVLSPWHVKGRHLPAAQPFAERVKEAYTAFINYQPPRPVPGAKHPLVERIARLPDASKRLEFMRRFEACGSFDPPMAQLSKMMRSELCGLC